MSAFTVKITFTASLLDVTWKIIQSIIHEILFVVADHFSKWQNRLWRIKLFIIFSTQCEFLTNLLTYLLRYLFIRIHFTQLTSQNVFPDYHFFLFFFNLVNFSYLDFKLFLNFWHLIFCIGESFCFRSNIFSCNAIKLWDSILLTFF